MRIDIDASGVGRAHFSDVALGSINVPLFGSRPVDRINIEANLSVTGLVPEPGFAGVMVMMGLAACRMGSRRRQRG